MSAAAVPCRLCGHDYPQHDPDGGHCLAEVGGELQHEHAVPCPCPGFRWVDLGPSVGSYTDPPQR